MTEIVAGIGMFTAVILGLVAILLAARWKLVHSGAVTIRVNDDPGKTMKVAAGELELNARRKTLSIAVTNTGDRPIQVGSHYHFFETNAALQFDRKKAYGCRLNIAAGTAVRFEPGQTRTVELVALVGDRKVFGFTGKVMGKLK